MLKTLHNLLITFLLALLLYGCEKDCAKPNGIYGDWVWTKTIDIASGYAITPAELGYNEKLKIDDFMYRSYINDSLSYESQYDLIVKTDSNNNERHFIVFASGYEEAIHIGESELIIAESIFVHQRRIHYRRD